MTPKRFPDTIPVEQIRAEAEPLENGAESETLVRAETQTLVQAVTHYSGVGRPVVMALIRHILERVDALNLTVHIQKTREYLTKLTALLTTLAMNYVYTDKFFED